MMITKSGRKTDYRSTSIELLFENDCLTFAGAAGEAAGSPESLAEELKEELALLES